MRIYFIRHGETESNRKHIHQPIDTGLSERGKKQSESVAALLKNHGIEKLLSSDLTRSVETAEVIGNALELPSETTELWRELRRPSALYNTSHYNPKTFEYVLQTIFNRNKSDWRYEDGESLFEAHERARRAELSFKEMHEQYQAIAVVTHAIFLEIFIKFMCKRGKTSLFDYLPIFSPFSTIKNGSLTVMEHFDTEAENVCAWSLELFNDTSHLRR